MANVRRYRVDIAGLHGGPGLSTFHFSTASPAQDCVDAVELFFQDMDAITENSILYVGQDVFDTIDMTTDQVIGSETVSGFSIAGTHADDPLPPSTQGLIRWATGVYLNGRKLQGHTYCPGPVEAFNTTAGQPSTGYQDGLLSAAGQILTADVGFCVYSRANQNFAVVNGFSVWSEWAVLRGRRDG